MAAGWNFVARMTEVPHQEAGCVYSAGVRWDKNARDRLGIDTRDCQKLQEKTRLPIAKALTVPTLT